MNNDIKRPIRSIVQRSRITRPQDTTPKSNTVRHKTPITGRHMDISKSRLVTRFKNIANPNNLSKANTDIAHQQHPLAKKADIIAQSKKLHANQPNVTPSSKQIKEEAIREAFQKLEQHQKQESYSQKRKLKVVNFFSIIVGFIFILVVAYLIYLNIPALSVNIANAQAGINAKIPEYKPDGYSLDGPATHSAGEVTIRFKSNDGTTSYSIRQEKSSWDSTAVKNQVSKESNGKFITTEDRGLTIFSYRGSAAWVNGGILYSVNGNAPLSSDQIRKIANSL